ncbi:MAG: hypothetical protein EBZ59_05830 [Planctomycetia bacterium]|nr:hypothetical protein [Planctomycetia bacterium]
MRICSTSEAIGGAARPLHIRWLHVGWAGCLAAAVLVTGCGRERVATPAADAGAAARIRATLASASGPAAAAEASVGGGTGWGTLKGRFAFAGTPGAAKPLVVDKDTEVCTKAGLKLVDRSLLVDPSSRGLANVVVFARKTSRVKEAAPPESPLVFDQKQCEFLTPVFAARVGRPIDVHNSDPIGHNTNIAGSAFNQLIPAGQGTVYKPTAETGMPTMVTCNIHPWMKAYAVFRKDGYVAVSAADGSFTIPDLPAGELIEFQVWHERSSGPNGALGLEKPDLKWTPKGRFQIRLEADEVKDLGTIDVPASAIGA